MTTLDCVEENVGGSIESVGKAVGDPLVTHCKSIGKCWNLPVQRKNVSVRFPVRGHKCSLKDHSCTVNAEHMHSRHSCWLLLCLQTLESLELLVGLAGLKNEITQQVQDFHRKQAF